MTQENPQGQTGVTTPDNTLKPNSVGVIAHKSLDEILTSIETREIVGALKQVQGQRTQAAKLLGISRSRLYRRMEALGIDPRLVNQQTDV